MEKLINKLIGNIDNLQVFYVKVFRRWAVNASPDDTVKQYDPIRYKQFIEGELGLDELAIYVLIGNEKQIIMLGGGGSDEFFSDTKNEELKDELDNLADLVEIYELNDFGQNIVNQFDSIINNKTFDFEDVSKLDARAGYPTKNVMINSWEEFRRSN